MIGVLSRHIALRSSHFGGEELVAEALDILKETSQKITIFIKNVFKIHDFKLLTFRILIDFVKRKTIFNYRQAAQCMRSKAKHFLSDSYLNNY